MSEENLDQVQKQKSITESYVEGEKNYEIILREKQHWANLEKFINFTVIRYTLQMCRGLDFLTEVCVLFSLYYNITNVILVYIYRNYSKIYLDHTSPNSCGIRYIGTRYIKLSNTTIGTREVLCTAAALGFFLTVCMRHGC